MHLESPPYLGYTPQELSPRLRRHLRAATAAEKAQCGRSRQAGAGDPPIICHPPLAAAPTTSPPAPGAPTQLPARRCTPPEEPKFCELTLINATSILAHPEEVAALPGKIKVVPETRLTAGGIKQARAFFGPQYHTAWGPAMPPRLGPGSSELDAKQGGLVVMSAKPGLPLMHQRPEHLPRGSEARTLLARMEATKRSMHTVVWCDYLPIHIIPRYGI